MDRNEAYDNVTRENFEEVEKQNEREDDERRSTDHTVVKEEKVKKKEPFKGFV